MKKQKPADGLDFEIPEIEILRRDLERDIVNRKIKAVDAASMKCLSRYRTRKQFGTLLEGAKIARVRRAGLNIVIDLTNDSMLVLSLGSTGSPRRNANKNPKVKGTEVVISFTQFGQLRFVDQHGTGDLYVVPGTELESVVPDIGSFGIDTIAKPVSWTDMGRSLLQRSGELKPTLTDNTFVVGIGNIYADEILFEAGVRHDRLCSSLSAQEIRRLHRALVGTIFDAMKYRGTSVPERPFCDVHGKQGLYGNHLKVWGKEGKLSLRSRAPIKRVKYGGTWTYYCDTQV